MAGIIITPGCRRSANHARCQTVITLVAPLKCAGALIAAAQRTPPRLATSEQHRQSGRILFLPMAATALACLRTSDGILTQKCLRQPAAGERGYATACGCAFVMEGARHGAKASQLSREEAAGLAGVGRVVASSVTSFPLCNYVPASWPR